VATCRQSPYLYKPAIVNHCDVILIMTSQAYVARSPRSHHDVILIVTSFANELATTTVTSVHVRTYVRTDGYLTAFNI